MTNLALLVARALILPTITAASGCATCTPATILVAERSETAQLNTGPGLMRTTETGRLEEAVTPTIARDYWLKSPDGRWHRVSREEYRRTQVGTSVQVCE